MLAPGIVGIGYLVESIGIDDHDDVALGIENVVKDSSIVLYANGPSSSIVGEVHGNRVIPVRHCHQLAAVVDVVPSSSAVAAAGTHSVRAIGVGPGGGAVAHAFQPAAS